MGVYDVGYFFTEPLMLMVSSSRSDMEVPSKSLPTVLTGLMGDWVSLQVVSMMQHTVMVFI